MTTAEQAKAAGFRSLDELSEVVGVATQTLRNWHKKSPELFDAALKRAVRAKND